MVIAKRKCYHYASVKLQKSRYEERMSTILQKSQNYGVEKSVHGKIKKKMITKKNVITAFFLSYKYQDFKNKI